MTKHSVFFYPYIARSECFLFLQQLATTAFSFAPNQILSSLGIIEKGGAKRRKSPSMSENTGIGSCCLSGAIHSGKPSGRVEPIGGLETYVSETENNSKAKFILFLVDSKPS